MTEWMTTSVKACKQEIQTYRAEINRIIDKIEASTLADLDDRHNLTKKKTGDTNHKIHDIHDKLIRFKSAIESDQSNDSQKFVAAKLSQCLMRQGHVLQSELTHDQTTELTFTRNTDIMNFLLRIGTLGLLSSSLIQDSSLPPATSSLNQPKEIQPTTSASTSDEDRITKKVTTRQQDTMTAIKPQRRSLYKKTSSAKYNIKQQVDDKTCFVRSSCILDTGNILLTDYANKKLKLVDSRSYTVSSSLELDTRPWSACRVRYRNAEAAVCLCKSTIQFVSTRGDKLVPVRTLRMNHECRCIDVIRDKMYLCDSKSIYVYKLNGKLVQTIRKDKLGHDILSYIEDITVSDDEKMIHVADMNMGVVSFNSNGTVVWRYSGTELSTTGGVCSDGNGNVIVCGWGSHNVVQLSPDGHYMGEIVTRSECVVHPDTVCYDRNNHKLFVGRYCDNNITVFTVQ